MVDVAVERRERQKKAEVGTQLLHIIWQSSSAPNASSSARSSPAHVTNPTSGRLSMGNVMRGPDGVMIDRIAMGIGSNGASRG
jgi:hypothetical protein